MDARSAAVDSYRRPSLFIWRGLRIAGVRLSVRNTVVLPWLMIALFAAAASGCGAGSRSVESEPASGSTASPAGIQREPRSSVGNVSFEATDGVLLQGRLRGRGRVAVVLSHMGSAGDSQADWYWLAEQLRRNGYMTLTYNRRGVCPGGTDGCSKGGDDLPGSWQDVAGAYDLVRRHGASEVVLSGASIGAMSSLYAAGRPTIKIAGINRASGYEFSRAELEQIEGAKLFMSSEEDIYGGAAAAQEWYRWAEPPKELKLLRGENHGTDMLESGEQTRAQVAQLIITFLARYAPAA